MVTSQLVNPFDKSGSLSIPKGETGKGSNADDIIDIFNQDDDKTIDKKEDEEPVVKKDKKDVKKDKKDEEDDLESKVDKEDEENEEDDEVKLKDEEDEEDDKEKLDLDKDDDKLNVPPKKREVLAKYPEFFKDFPAIEKMIFRDREYTELFGSFDEAKEIAAKVEVLNGFESQLLSGNTGEILKTVKDTDSKAYDKIVDNYIGILEKVDKEAYLEVVGNLGKQIIMGMVNESKRTENDELKNAATLLHQYLFATSEWTPIKLRVSVDTKENEESKKLEEERNQFTKERFEVARDDLQVRVDNVLKSTITDLIDPRGVMSNYEKKNAIKEALDSLHELVSKDLQFQKNLNRLWQNSAGEKFSRVSLDKIKSSYLGKSKTVLMGVIKKVRQEALKDSGNRESTKKDEKDESEEQEKKETSPERKTIKTNAGRPNQQTKKANERQPGESVADFFARD